MNLGKLICPFSSFYLETGLSSRVVVKLNEKKMHEKCLDTGISNLVPSFQCVCVCARVCLCVCVCRVG